jgi:2-polyprenyl-3-methyl-5-hydroxy-6-metoxy-1,4-benzoquinol methylase
MTTQLKGPLKDNSEFRALIDSTADQNRDTFTNTGWWHSIDLGAGRITQGVRKLDDLQFRYANFNLPKDLSGKRVLDIGCWDGFFSFEAERHGAEVVAVDCWRPGKFFEAHRALDSRVEFHELSVYELSREKLGVFDYVFFLGVLYHLQHPLLALQRVCEVTSETAIIDSYIIDNILATGSPVMEFYPNDELGGQYDNWWGPNTECLVKMALSVGFAQISLIYRETTAATIKAQRRFSDLPANAVPSIYLDDVNNACTYKHHFPRRGRNAVLAIWAKKLPALASRQNVRVTLGDYGVRPAYVGKLDEAGSTQINIAVPPGLEPGPHKVKVYCEGQTSNEVEIEIVDAGEW